MALVGLKEIDEKILKYTNTDDLLRWCWNSATIREMCYNSLVWSRRMISVDSIYTVQQLLRYRNYIDCMDLASCDNIVTSSIDGFNLKGISFKGNSWIDDDNFTRFIERNGRNCKFVDISNCLNLTNKSLFAIAESCQNLEKLNCSGGLFTFSGLYSLKDCKYITSLSLSNCILLSTDNLISILAQFPRLKRIDLSTNSSVNYNMLNILLPLLPALQHLDICGCEELNGYQIETLQKSYPQIVFVQNARIYDDSIESIRAYLLSMLRTS